MSKYEYKVITGVTAKVSYKKATSKELQFLLQIFKEKVAWCVLYGFLVKSWFPQSDKSTTQPQVHIWKFIFFSNCSYRHFFPFNLWYFTTEIKLTSSVIQNNQYFSLLQFFSTCYLFLNLFYTFLNLFSLLAKYCIQNIAIHRDLSLHENTRYTIHSWHSARTVYFRV